MQRPSKTIVGLFLLVLINATLGQANGAVVSTIDEWANRFIPEQGPTLDLPTYFTAYEKAAAQIDAGRYRLALCTLGSIEKPDAVRSAVLRARALMGLGEGNDAVNLLNAVTPANDPAVLACEADLLLQLNKPEAAQPVIDELLKSKPADVTARLMKGKALEALGDFPAAIAAYRWFLEPPQSYLTRWQAQPDQFESADEIVAFATAIHRCAILTMEFKSNTSLNDTLLGMFTRAYDVVDRNNISARIAAAQFAISHNDGPTTAKILAPLIKSRSTNRQVLETEAEFATLSGDEKVMQRVIDTLRDGDPQSAPAGILEVALLARAHAAGTYPKAAALAKAHPENPEAIGTFAAISLISGHDDESNAILAEADKHWPKSSEAYRQAAEFLEMASQREAAVRLLNVAVARTPWETRPRHLLGDIYLNDGYDDKARAALEEAFALDPYNIKTLNFIRLLDELDRYDKRVSEHFIIYSDKDADPIAADQIGTYMEQVYAEVCSTFHYQPTTKMVVQIYPEDDAFSVRMAGVPGVENYGVSFGRVLAAIAPRAGTAQGNFNFSRVLKHEFVHTINLLQTNQHCPRWLTEGLAVWQEGVPFRFVDVPPELYKRTMADELFTIRSFPLAFLRPTRPHDGEQAYTQGAYLARYLDETYGGDSIVRLLDAYGRSLNDEQAFAAATGKSLQDFENDWHAWMKKTIGPWGYDEKSIEKAGSLQEEAEAAIKQKAYPEALTLWQEASNLQPMEMKPHQRLAFLYLQPALSDPAKAAEHLKFLHFLELSDNRYAKQISRLYTKIDNMPDAIAWARQATYVNLYDPAAHQMLADLLEKSGDKPAAEVERQAVSQIQLWQQRQALKKKPAPAQ